MGSRSKGPYWCEGWFCERTKTHYPREFPRPVKVVVKTPRRKKRRRRHKHAAQDKGRREDG